MIMSAGVMEQFGTTEEVYNRPATMFVAGFMGSAPMNLLENIRGSPAHTITGIRPEHLDITAEGWALQVEAVEMLGAERLVHGRWAHGAGTELVTIRKEAAP